MNTYLKYQPPAVQFMAFLAFAGGFYFLGIIINYFFFQDVNAIILHKDAVVTSAMITKFKLVQAISAIVSFLVPALLMGYYSSPKPLPYIGLQRFISPVLILAVVALWAFIQPFIGYLSDVNSHINFGSFTKTVTEIEALYDRAFKIFLKMDSTSDLVINLIIMALLPAVCEELFFRGAFQKVLLRLSNRPWVSILVSSLVFALFHVTFLKVIPIFSLGLLLGTVYHFTRNIWYTIVIHFINNGIAVIAFYYGPRSQLLRKLTDDSVIVPLYVALLSAASAAGILYFIGKKGKQVLPLAVTSEDNDFIA